MRNIRPDPAREMTLGARAESRQTAQLEPVDSAPTLAVTPPRIELGFGNRSSREVTQAQAGPPTFPAQVFDPRRFEGTGRVSGRLVLADPRLLPRHWTLVLEPSRVLHGGEHARARSVEFEHGEHEFLVEDLPLGGYRMLAKAHGLVGREEHVLLARPDNQTLVVELQLLPPARCIGRLVDARGLPIVDLAVWASALADGKTYATKSDAAGHWRLEVLPEGEYQLCVGSVEAPLTAPVTVTVQAPQLTVPDICLPDLGWAQVRVVDTRGRPLADCKLEAWGEEHGSASARSGADGRARIGPLPVGRVKIVASHEDAMHLVAPMAFATASADPAPECEIVLGSKNF